MNWDSSRARRRYDPNGFRGEKNGEACRQRYLDEWDKMLDEMIEEARRREATGERDEMLGAKRAAIPRPMKKSSE
jgi:hypothetical protein